MNDPGLDAPIDRDAQILESKKEDDELDEAEEDEQAFLAPSRWWLASTAFPLIAGTFGPMASAFSICALMIHWRVTIPPGANEATGDGVDDPKWLVGINAAQLVIALISNLFLLLNMARRVRFSVAQPITIVGWYLSSLTLVGLTATAAGPLRLDDSTPWAWTQAFYYAIISAGLYFMVASLMVVTVIGAYRGRYEKEFKLTTSQRTLMLQTISFLVYLLLGATVYSHIESWAFLDALYFADFTLLTIGIGDLHPQTDVGRGLLFPFAIGGIIILGLVIGSIRSLVLERGKEKLGARMVEKERRRILKEVNRKKGELLIPIDNEKSKGSGNDVENDDNELTERERRRKEFHIMRKVQDRAATRRRWMSLAVSASTWFALWFIGAAVFQATETSQQWSYFTGLYFSYTTLLTIGYGDIYPISNAGRPFFVFWSLLAVPSLTILISNMGDTIVKAIRDLTLKIGELTVLPDESGVRATMKHTLHQLTNGRAFAADVKASPPGIFGELDNKAAGENDDSNQPKNDPDSSAQRAADNEADVERKGAKEEAKTDDKHARPKSKRHYHSILINEISSVMKHLNSSPPRKYTFDEWAWYLELIGEDESSPETHRRAIRKPKMDSDREGVAATTGRNIDAEKKVKWSWVGNRSPLMGNKEEAEWVLERLTRTLARELEAMRKEEEEGTGDFAEGGKMAGKFRRRNSDRKPSREDNGQDRDLPQGVDGEAGPSIESSRTATREREDSQRENEEDR